MRTAAYLVLIEAEEIEALTLSGWGAEVETGQAEVETGEMESETGGA